MINRRAVAVLLCAVSGSALGLDRPLNTGLISVNSVRLNSSSITTLPLNSPPINGFTAQLVFGLTDRQDSSGNENFASVPSTLPDGGSTMPIGSSPYYSTAIFDTGSQSDLFRFEDKQIFNFDSANREGGYTQDIEGASGTETTDISDALGVYASGFANASVVGGSLSVPQSSLVGQWNTSVLTTQSAPSDLPNLIGAPMAAQYQTVISNSQTRRLTVGAQTLRSPQVSFQALNKTLPGNYVRLSLTVQSPEGNFPDPEYFPSFDNFNNSADNPSTPSFWESFFANVNVSHSGGSVSNASFLLDSGAQVTVLSEDTAASVGFFSAGPNPSTPDFYVTVSGVGGTTQNVPGFYLNSLSVITNGGPLNWTHVPVVVMDLPNPGTGSGFVPGILGTNLFTDRDLILNGDVSTPWLGISPQLTPQWNANSDGNWGDDTKWVMGVPDGDVQDAQANFLSAITAPHTITVDGNYTVGSITFNNANRYTLAGSGTLTLQNSSGTAKIEAVTGNHTIAAPLVFASNTMIAVDSSAQTLSITGGISATGVTTTKSGPGQLAVGGNANHFGTLLVQQGKMQLLPGLTTATTVNSLTISSGAALDLSNNSLIVNYTGTSPISTIASYLKTGFNGGTWTGSGINSSTAANNSNHTTALGYAEASDLGLANGGTFAGQSIANEAVLIKYTYYGDENLDGVVNLDDFSIFIDGYNGLGSGWIYGDFNYDGVIDQNDFGLFVRGFDLNGQPLSQLDDAILANPDLSQSQKSAMLAAVPEPSSVAVLLTLCTPLFSRRRNES